MGNARRANRPPRSLTDPVERAEADLNAAQRERQALSMRVQGYDFDAIAQACGYANRSAAYKAYRRALARIPQRGVEEARQRMAEGYNLVRHELWKSVMAGDARAVQAWVQMDERESKLFGYDAPPPKQEAQLAPTVIIRTYGAPDSPVNTDLL